MKRYLPFVLIALVLVLSIGGGALLLRSKKRSAAVPITLAQGKPGAEPAHIRGGARARVTVEEFGDFQCVPCGVLKPILDDIEKSYGDQLRLVFREFPLQMHKHAFEAACAAEAAALQNRFWEMHRVLYENAAQWSKGTDIPPIWQNLNLGTDTRSMLIGYAKSLGLDVPRFIQDMDGEQVKARIAADRDRGTSLGVDRTPSLFINGKPIPPADRNANALRRVIDTELNAKK